MNVSINFNANTPDIKTLGSFRWYKHLKDKQKSKTNAVNFV